MVESRLLRGTIWWTDLPEVSDAGPGFHRPALIVQADSFNRSGVATVVVAPLTSNLTRANAPGNVLVSASESGLSKDSVVNVSQLTAVDKGRLRESCGHLGVRSMRAVDDGIRTVLGLLT